MKLANRVIHYSLPSLVSMGLSVAMLPLLTAKLDPMDFGLLALLQSFGGLVIALSGLGASMIWAERYPQLTESQKPGFVTAMVMVTLLMGVVWSSLFWLGWSGIAGLHPALAGVDPRLLRIILVGAILMQVWVHTQEYLVLEGKAGAYAAIAISSAAASQAIALVGLYGLGMGVEALFVSYLISAIVFCSRQPGVDPGFIDTAGACWLGYGRS